MLPAASDFLLEPVSDLAPAAVDWFWPGRLAFGKLAVLDGDPGLGKSLLALDLAARLSTGRALPDDSTAPTAASAIVLNGEDGAHDTLRPRLHALGADLARVFVLSRPPERLAGPPRFPSHARLLDDALARTAARLVIIDPVMAFLDPNVATASDQSVRHALDPLNALAQKHRAVILLIRHLNKTARFHALYRGGGSIGLVGACRSGWLLVRDPHHPDRRVLAQVKNNLAAPQPSIAFTVAATGITWLGPCPWTGDMLLAAAAKAPRGLPPRDRARDFLAAALADGSRTSRELWQLAQKENLGARTLRRAKLDLNVRSVRLWADGRRLSYWLLPGQQLPASVPPEAAPPDLEPWLAPLREKYPPLTPLDDL